MAVSGFTVDVQCLCRWAKTKVIKQFTGLTDSNLFYLNWCAHLLRLGDKEDESSLLTMIIAYVYMPVCTLRWGQSQWNFRQTSSHIQRLLPSTYFFKHLLKIQILQIFIIPLQMQFYVLRLSLFNVRHPYITKRSPLKSPLNPKWTIWKSVSCPLWFNVK